MLDSIIRLGTRQSPMALKVAEDAKALITNIFPNISVEIHSYVSDGDKIKGSLVNFGGKGSFIKNLEERLLNDEIDCAIHALKDIPCDEAMHDELDLIAFLPAEAPNDAMVFRDGFELAKNEKLEDLEFKIGTSSPRRTALCRHYFPKAKISPCRGNVNNRIRKLDSGEYDALVLASSGLQRIGFGYRISRDLDCEKFIPPAGQGILCIQVKKENIKRFGFLTALNDANSSQRAKTERDFIFAISGNCHTAASSHLVINDNDYHFMAAIYGDNRDSSYYFERTFTKKNLPENLGQIAANELLKNGASKIL